MSAAAMWLGPVHSEARAAFQRARVAGLSPMRALVIGSVASFKECWAFRKKLAKQAGCSIRTVQRALTQAREQGLIGVARAKKTEVPPHWPHGPVTCGWSHRWVIGWGQAGQAVGEAVDRARARWLVKHAAPEKMTTAGPERVNPLRTPPPSPRNAHLQGLSMSERVAYLDAELERMASSKPPPL